MPVSAVFRPFDALLGWGRHAEPVYHRFSNAEEADEVERSGELWGAPPRNIFASSIPCVKAYAGRLRRAVRGTSSRLRFGRHTPRRSSAGGWREHRE
jgi:hypothetical protein